MGKLDFRLRSQAPILSSGVFWEKRTVCTAGKEEGEGLGLDMGLPDEMGRESEMPPWECQSWVSEIGGRDCFCLLLISFVSKNINVRLWCLESFPGRTCEEDGGEVS